MRLLFLTLLSAIATCSASEMFAIVQGNSKNNVSFTSDAPLEAIVGKTNVVTGFVMLPDGSSQGSAEIHVDLASLDTGMSLRNKHMRENHLETEKYPEAVFKLSSLDIPGGSLAEGQRLAVTVKGTLTMHGKSQEITPLAWLTLAGEELTIEASFNVLLNDYDIKRPEFLIMKLAEDQRIDVKLVGRRSQ